MTMETLQENVFLGESGMNFIQWRRSVWMFFLAIAARKECWVQLQFPPVQHIASEKKHLLIFSELVLS